MIYLCSEKINKIQFDLHKERVLMLYWYETNSTWQTVFDCKSPKIYFINFVVIFKDETWRRM